MSLYDKQIMSLAAEIAQHAGSDHPGDIDHVAEWLVNGGDDGSPVPELCKKFDREETLPSKG